MQSDNCRVVSLFCLSIIQCDHENEVKKIKQSQKSIVFFFQFSVKYTREQVRRKHVNETGKPFNRANWCRLRKYAIADDGECSKR